MLLYILGVNSHTTLVDADTERVSANSLWMGADLYNVLRDGRGNWFEESSAIWESVDVCRCGADGYSQRSQVGWVDTCRKGTRSNLDTEGVGWDGLGMSTELNPVRENLHGYWSEISDFYSNFRG